MDDLQVGDVVDRARSLLGRAFTGHGVTVVLTEVEAYGGIEDPASHAFTRTPRSETMYGPSGRLYVYRSYGIHHCANIVTGPQELAAAVLLRAGRVIDGHDLARQRRGPVADTGLARGPGNLAQALGITLDDLGTPVTTGSGLGLGERLEEPEILAGPRVGVTRAADEPWRFWSAGDPTVSAYRRSPRAPRASHRRPQ